jgi:hypothetical protein
MEGGNLMAKFTWQQEEDFLKASMNFSMNDAVDWIKRNLEPEDVFDKNDLEGWAESNGYIKEE